MTGGNLVIQAKQREHNGRDYTSARIITKGKQNFKFGRIDVRAKLPKGKGMWPAIWMLGADDRPEQLAQLRRNRHHGAARQPAQASF